MGFTAPQDLEADWILHAACNPTWSNVDPEDFAFTDSSPARKTLQLKLISDFCHNCDVIEQCGLSANEDDKYYTIRGGELPGRMSDKPRGRPVGGKLLADGHCKSGGHTITSLDDIRQSKNGKNECLVCYENRKAGERESRKTGEKPPRFWDLAQPGDLCPNGTCILTEARIRHRRCFRCDKKLARDRARQEAGLPPLLPRQKIRNRVA